MTNTVNEEIAFIQFHEPPLKSGEYSLQLSQQISVPDCAGSLTTTSETYQQTRRFYVAGERFSLQPQNIHCQFPPPANRGDHSNVLPHIVLTRSTLPWERDADPEDSELPWLWLFIFDEQDIAAGRMCKPEAISVNQIVTFIDPGNGKPLGQPLPHRCVELEAEPEENLSQSVSALKAKASWLQEQSIVPSSAALKLLTSVRKTTTAADSTEWAVCVANRLPLAGGTTYAHLVTLENRFNKGAFDFSLNADPDGNISFISLASWQFYCPDDITYQCNQQTLNKLSKKAIPQALINDIEKLPADALYESTDAIEAALKTVISDSNQAQYLQQQKNILNCLQVPTATFKGLMDQLNRGNLQLPSLATTGEQMNYLAAANQYIQRGAVALPHHLRQGGDTVSWYHGPLIGGSDPEQISATDIPVTLPVTASDQLLRFDTLLGMFDVSYAAAWQLGRLLTLNNRNLAMKLYAWKRQQAWHLKQQEQALLYGHLPFASSSASDNANADHGQSLADWFNDLNLLHHIPFNYLVPDETLLPEESIRFFTLDNLWLDCLMDGAFSIGRVTEADCQRDSALQQTATATYPDISGFLLRSEAVSGWPALQISASSQRLAESKMPESNAPLTILRRENLAPNILLCLFQGQAATVDIHLAPESLHFGFDRPFGAHTTFYKELKDLTSGEITAPLQTTDICWLPTAGSNSRVVDIVTLADNIATALQQPQSGFTSAQMTLEMIEGVPRARFLVGTVS